MLVDSHCHLQFPELKANLADYLMQMQANDVTHALCVSTKVDHFTEVIAIAEQYENVFASVGIHPEEVMVEKHWQEEFLLSYTKYPKVIAIGETGLDYYPALPSKSQLLLQQESFSQHIAVAKYAQLPLIIHTRNSIEDVVAIAKANQAHACGAVMHCFTESVNHAKSCLDLGFYISISGIVTFKNALDVQNMVKYVPLDRLLIETDSPFLAPAPFRGKLNHPALIKHTAAFIANLLNLTCEDFANITTANFFNLFTAAV